MGTLGQDLRYGWRTLRKNPGFTFVAVVVLALGIGANTAIFSVVNAFLLQPLPVRDPDGLVQLITLQGPDPVSVSAIEYDAWRSSAASLETVTLGLPDWGNLTGDAEPQRVSRAAVFADFFPALGVEPLLGRNFLPEETRGEPARVALLSYALWQQRYGGDPGVVGRTVLLDDVAHEIVGVVPPGIDLPFRTALWTPLSLDPLPENQRGIRNYFGLARLRAGFSPAAADEELRVIARRLEGEFPATHAGWSAKAVPLRHGLLEDFRGNVHRGLLALLAAVGFLLLIASANLANLFLSRAIGRRHEVALRLALGASRGRLVQQFLVETSLVLAVGAAAGVLAAVWATPLLVRLIPVETLALSDHLLAVRLDARVLAFTFAVTVLTGLLVGLLPALRASRPDLRQFLNEQATAGSLRPGARRLMETTVVVQVALTLTLLTAAVMTVHGFGRLLQMPLGFRPAGVVALELSLSPGRYAEEVQRALVVEQLAERARAVPGVRAAGVSTNAPLSHNYWDARFECEGRPAASESEVLLTADRLVTPGYLEALGVTLLKGRLISAEDRAGSQPAVVVSQTLARICWPGEDPIGKRVRRISRVIPAPWMSVVGLVADVKEDRSGFHRDRAVWYVPYAQLPQARPFYLLARSEGDPMQVVAGLRREIQSLDANLPVADVQPLEAYVASIIRPDRFSAFVMLFFAGMGLALAAVGLFGLLSYAAMQRTREMGLRMALGAQPSDILRLVVGQGVRLTLAGVALGLAGALAAVRVGAQFVFGADKMGAATIAAAAALLIVVSMLASYLPARRAARADPMRALRYE
jgi:predicted permease